MPGDSALGSAAWRDSQCRRHSLQRGTLGASRVDYRHGSAGQSRGMESKCLHYCAVHGRAAAPASVSQLWIEH